MSLPLWSRARFLNPAWWRRAPACLLNRTCRNVRLGSVKLSAVSRRARLVGWLGLTLIATLLFGMPCVILVKSAKEYASGFQNQLTTRIFLYWFDTSLDTNNGGYVLADDGKGHRVAKEKQLVSQARMLWTFSHVHRKGYSDERRDYLKAAAHGYRFLQERFFDRVYGGYFWKTDLSGKPTNDRKIVYGQAF